MDSFLSSISSKQAVEWELFAGENPTFEDKLLNQIAYITAFFSNCFVKRKDKKEWQIKDFMPWLFKKEQDDKEKKNEIVSSFKNLLVIKGDKKAKDWAVKEEQQRPKVKGTNGKMYTYALEEFANNKKIPRRMR